MGYYNGEDRDTRCALDVGKMSALGRFDKEIELYGCAYSGNGRVFYCISRFEKAVWQVVEQSADQHIYPTPVESYIKRVSVPAGMYEEILEQTKLEMAKKLKCQFGEIYFEQMMPLMLTEPNDAAYSLLDRFVEVIDGYFNADWLWLFKGALHFAYDAKVLSEEHFRQFGHWVADCIQQMAEDPALEENISRIFYGIYYLDKEGREQYFIDAQKLAVLAKKQQLTIAGMMTTPIFAKQYSMKNGSQLPAAKMAFKNKMNCLLSKAYWRLLNEIKALPGVIDRDQLKRVQQSFTDTGRLQAVAAVQYYEQLWNPK